MDTLLSRLGVFIDKLEKDFPNKDLSYIKKWREDLQKDEDNEWAEIKIYLGME